jgi:threonine 3-dehydrogenase
MKANESMPFPRLATSSASVRLYGEAGFWKDSRVKSDTMTAVRKLRADRGLELAELPVPRPGPEDCLVYVEAASICGTDVHIWNWDRWSQRRIKPPLTLGHEFCGTVTAVGDKVRHVQVGDYVSAESHVTCGMCYQCRTGQAHLCPNTQILGVDRDGAFAHYVVVPEKVIWQNDRAKLPPEIATIQEPFGNAVFATMNQDMAGESVAVLGCGPIGLFTIGIAKAVGAKAVFGSDVNPYRINLARVMGATDVFHPGESDGRGDVVSRIVAANGGYGVDIVLEMSGAAAAITTAFRVVRNGGTVVLFGIPAAPVEIDVAENMIFKNLTVRALNGRRIFDTWYKTRWLLEGGVVDLRPLITKTIGFDEVNDAVAMLSRGEACKIVLLPNGGRPAALPEQRRVSVPKPNITGTPVHR